MTTTENPLRLRRPIGYTIILSVVAVVLLRVGWVSGEMAFTLGENRIYGELADVLLTTLGYVALVGAIFSFCLILWRLIR